MSETRCRECGGDLPGKAWGACPACALSAGLLAEDRWKEFFHPDGRAREFRKERGDTVEGIGPNLLLEIIGEGGMGVVWKAFQSYPVQREVALKLIRQGVGTAEIVERFDSERQSLAKMSHEGIVHIFDAGETESGRPYFVMELIDGTPLTEYSDREELPLAARLELFLGVVRAVQHAHQKGVLHRDLKPSNILVADDGKGRAIPKLIDFGIARAIERTGADGTLLTMPGQAVGTPQYMSPEQAAGGGIDTRTDVYGLGAILYELVSGSPPIPRERIAGASPEELLRIVREFEPQRPSARISTRTRKASETRSASDAGRRRWRRVLREELDWIVLRCLEKDPERRYESSGALADDVQRYLEGNPVSARPPSRVYRLKKFIRRNRLLAASMITVAATLAAATALSVRWALAADTSRKLAEARLAQADAVPDFLFNAFRQAGRTGGGAEMSAIDVLRAAEKEVEGEFADQPLIRARIQESIGQTYEDLGRNDLAARTLGAALESYRGIPGNEEAVSRLSVPVISTLRTSGGAETSVALSEGEWRDRENSLGVDDPKTHQARLNYCRSLLEVAYWDDSLRVGYLNRVDALLREVTDTPDRFPKAVVRDYEAARAELAAGRGDHAAALEFWEPELNRFILGGGAHSEGRLWPSRFHVAALRRNGRFDEAAAAAESLVLHCRDFYGLTHENTVRDTRSLSIAYDFMGLHSTGYLACRQLVPGEDEKVDPLFQGRLKELEEWAESLPVSSGERDGLQRMILATKSGKPSAAKLIESAHGRAGILFWFAELCLAQGHPKEAIALAEESHKASLAAYGLDSPLETVRATRLAEMWLKRGDLKRVETFLDERIPEPEAALTWVDGIVLDLAIDLAAKYASLPDDGAAIRVARRVADLRLGQHCAGLPFLEKYEGILRAPATKAKDSSRMAKVYEELVPIFIASLGENHVATSQRKQRHVEALIGCGRIDDALANIKKFYSDNEAWGHRTVHWRIAEGRAYTVSNQFESAEAALNRAWRESIDLGFGKMNGEVGVRQAARKTAEQFVALYVAMKRPHEEAKWRQTLGAIQP